MVLNIFLHCFSFFHFLLQLHSNRNQMGLKSELPECSYSLHFVYEMLSTKIQKLIGKLGLVWLNLR